MEVSGQYTRPVEIIREEEKREGYTIGPTTVEYSPLQLQKHFQKLAETSNLPKEQAEQLAQNTTICFDLLSYYKHVFKHSPLSRDNFKIKNASKLLAWSEVKKSFLTLSDIAHATELVFPDAEHPAIMINLRKIEKDLPSYTDIESRQAALKAVLGEYWTQGCNEIIELQNPQKKIVAGLQKVVKKTGLGVGAGMLNFASTVLPVHAVPFPYSVAVGPAVNIATNLLSRKKIEPHSNPDSVLFDVHYDPKVKQYTPLPPFLPLD